MKRDSNDYVIRVLESPDQVNAANWNQLLSLQSEPTPFMRHEYLHALHQSGSATPETGWTPRFITLQQDDVLVAACVLYLKTHSYGEYVFDHAWANAYAQHGLNYYPKALVAVPFTPVQGSRLLARSPTDRQLLVKALLQWCDVEKLSSLHLLFCSVDDQQACEQAGLMLRHGVQFHWNNQAPQRSSLTLVPGLAASRAAPPPEGANFAFGGPGGETQRHGNFEDFLASLSQEKRKKIRQERRKVADAGVTFRSAVGVAITATDWEFFYRCYARTYLEHGNAPYLNREFFHIIASSMPENWLLFIAQRQGQDIAASLLAIDASGTMPVAYGRYWGALERVDCLHFEACYYQPLQWCIAQGYQRFEGGAQGEHKMARALLPIMTGSAHWLAHPAFAAAVERFLEREDQGIDRYLEDLGRRSPFKKSSE
ncbi:MAG: GNAT family N-acetyltransferase [Comamonadaceae bacterium]